MNAFLPEAFPIKPSDFSERFDSNQTGTTI